MDNFDKLYDQWQDKKLNDYLESQDDTFTGKIEDYEIITLINNIEYCLYLTDIIIESDEFYSYKTIEAYSYNHNIESNDTVDITLKEYESKVNKKINDIIDENLSDIIQYGARY